MKNHFVLMADIIASSEKDSDQLMISFKKLVTKTNAHFSKSIISPLTITLGDEFQGITQDLKSAVEIIFYLDEQLLREDIDYNLRYIVNYGRINTEINKQTSYEMLGDGLTAARRMLSDIKSTPFEIRVTGIESNLQSKLNLAFELYRSVYNDWSGKDKKVVSLFLEYGDYRIVAEKYERDPSSMWRREKSLKIREFNASRKLIRKIAND